MNKNTNSVVWAIRRSFSIYREANFRILMIKIIDFFLWKSNKFIFIPWFPGLTFGVNGFVWTVGLQTKYLSFNDQIMPNREGGGIVIEAGVYAGNDTASYAKLGHRVFAFEPSPRNYEKASINLRRFSNVELINAGLWSHPSELEIQLGESGYDDGFLEPDNPLSGSHDEESIFIRVDTIENFVSELNINPKEIELIKIEAEGAEPEILEGLGKIRPKHVVVNGDEERDGNPTGLAVAEILQPLGYELVGMTKGHILFFTQRPIASSAFRNEFSD